MSFIVNYTSKSIENHDYSHPRLNDSFIGGYRPVSRRSWNFCTDLTNFYHSFLTELFKKLDEESILYNNEKGLRFKLEISLEGCHTKTYFSYKVKFISSWRFEIHRDLGQLKMLVLGLPCYMLNSLDLCSARCATPNQAMPGNGVFLNVSRRSFYAMKANWFSRARTIMFVRAIINE